jgi:hypothetical protein
MQSNMNEAGTLKAATVGAWPTTEMETIFSDTLGSCFKHEAKISRSLISLSAIMKIDDRSNQL